MLKDFRGLWTVLDCDVGFGGFNIDFPGFWSILGDFWGAMLEPFWNPKRTKIEKNRDFHHFSEHLRGKLSRRRFRDHFRSAWRGQK